MCQASEGKYKLKWDDGDVRIYEKNGLNCVCFFALITAHNVYTSLITAKILTQKRPLDAEDCAGSRLAERQEGPCQNCASLVG